jgi:hypothetical protein
MPEYQGQLRDLFALLAQLQQRRFARHRLHELRDPVQNALIFLRHANVCVRLNVVGRPARSDHVVARQSGAVVARDAIVVLLLGRHGCCGGCLCLRLSLRLRLLRLELTVLAYMVVRLLVMTLGPLARVLLLVREDMLHLSLILVVVQDRRDSWIAEEVRYVHAT